MGSCISVFSRCRKHAKLTIAVLLLFLRCLYVRGCIGVWIVRIVVVTNNAGVHAKHPPITVANAGTEYYHIITVIIIYYVYKAHLLAHVLFRRGEL